MAVAKENPMTGLCTLSNDAISSRGLTVSESQNFQLDFQGTGCTAFLSVQLLHIQWVDALGEDENERNAGA